MATQFIGDKLKPFIADEMLTDAEDVEYEVTGGTNTNVQTEVENTLNSASITGQTLTLTRRGGSNPVTLTIPNSGSAPNLNYNRVITTSNEVLIGFVPVSGLTNIASYSYVIVQSNIALITLGYLQSASSQGAYWILHNNTNANLTIRGLASSGARTVRIRGSTSSLMTEIIIPPQQTFFVLAETYGGTGHDYYKIDCIGRIDSIVGGNNITATTTNNTTTLEVTEEATHFTAVQGTDAQILIGYDVNVGLTPVKPYSYLYVTNSNSLLNLDFLRGSIDQGAFWFIRNATTSTITLRGRATLTPPIENVRIIGATALNGREIQLPPGSVYLLIAQSFTSTADHFYLAQPLSETGPTDLYYNLFTTSSTSIYFGFVANGSATPTDPYSYVIADSPQAVITLGYLQKTSDQGAYWLVRNNTINLLRIQGLTTAGANRHVRFRNPTSPTNLSELILPPGQLFLIVAETFGGTGHDYYRVNCLGRLDSVRGDGDIVTQTDGNNAIVGLRENYQYFLPADGTSLTTYFGFVDDVANNPPIDPYTYTNITNTFTTATIGFMQKALDEGAFWLIHTTTNTGVQLTGNSVAGQTARIDGATELNGRRITLQPNQMYLLMARDYNATGDQFYLAHCLGRLDQVIGGYNTDVSTANNIATINQTATPIVLIRENNFVMSVLTLPETIASNRVSNVTGVVDTILPAAMSTTIGKKLTVINSRTGTGNVVHLLTALNDSFLGQTLAMLILGLGESVTLFCSEMNRWELVSSGAYSDVS